MNKRLGFLALLEMTHHAEQLLFIYINIIAYCWNMWSSTIKNFIASYRIHLHSLTDKIV